MKDYVLSKGRLNSTPKLTTLLSFTRFVPVVLVRYVRYGIEGFFSFFICWDLIFFMGLCDCCKDLEF